MHRTAYPKAPLKQKEMIMGIDALVYQGEIFVTVFELCPRQKQTWAGEKTSPFDLSAG